MNDLKGCIKSANSGRVRLWSITSLNNFKPTANAVACSAGRSPRCLMRLTMLKMSS